MTKSGLAKLVERRGELITELFLDELQPGAIVAQPSNRDVGYDFLVNAKNRLGGINTYAVQYEATDQPISATYRVTRDLFDRMTYSNIPMLFLVVDVKRNEIYYALLESDKTSRQSKLRHVPIELKRIDETETVRLRKRLASIPQSRVLAG